MFTLCSSWACNQIKSQLHKLCGELFDLQLNCSARRLGGGINQFLYASLSSLVLGTQRFLVAWLLIAHTEHSNGKHEHEFSAGEKAKAKAMPEMLLNYNYQRLISTIRVAGKTAAKDTFSVLSGFVALRRLSSPEFEDRQTDSGTDTQTVADI